MGKGNGKNAAMNIAKNLYNALGGEDGGQGLSNSEKDGRYYTFAQNFPEYKKYANTALRALAFYMGIQDISVQVMKMYNYLKLILKNFYLMIL